MSGIYGTVRPAIINVSKDVTIYYNYRKTRSSSYSTEFKELDSSLITSTNVEGEPGTTIPGLYNLRLPLSIFGYKGVYTLYITPKELTATIADVGVLNNYTDVRGVVFQASGDFSNMTASDALAGYRIDFSSSDGERTSLLILSSNLCMQNDNGTSENKKYSYSSRGNYIFCTVTPSIASSFNKDNVPYIGEKNTEIKLVNTKFSPVMYEIEMVNHDADTISNMLEGDQVRNLDTGVITTYNEDGEIYNQTEYANLKSTVGKPLYDIKKKMSTIDTTQEYNNIVR